ncbi:MAG TPA: ATP-binding cassette domain-containing protein [Methanothrix soehngenii]|nr:ATP-binding cassette domain-containing protein [Methanothrix soehngenii]
MSCAIETWEISKRYGSVAAVDAISLCIEPGEIFGLLGPNGAGKTTLIKILTTMTEPSGGQARVWGYDVIGQASSVRMNIGVVFQDITLDDRLTGRENLDLHGRLYGLDGRARKKRIEEVLALVEMADRAYAVVRTYSGGMMRRLEIARGFMHRPNVLFLDEPTLGLDPQTRARIWEYIKRLADEEGVTVVLTTHYMEEADHLCHRIGIIDRGRIVALDSPRAMKDRLGGDVITLKLADANDGERLAAVFRDQGLAGIISKRDGELSLAVARGEEQIPRVLSLASAAGIAVHSVSLHRPTLDDVFLHHTGRAIRDKDAGEAEHLGHRMRSGRR